MHQTSNSTSSISKLINLHPLICSPSKQSLWRQLQSNENLKQEPIRKNSCNLQQQQQLITPIGRKKQKSTTISNFLKHLQVQVQPKDQRLQTESEIVSIMDIRYNDSFYSRSLSHKKYPNGKSFLADSKFSLILTIASVKQFFTSFKGYVETIVSNYQSDLQNFARNTKKLLSQYESSLSEKALHIKTVELQLREQQLQHIHEIHILKSHLQTATSNLQSLQQKYTTLDQILKSQKMNYEQIKCHNRQLSELLLKYHHKTQALQIKIEEIKKEAEQKMLRETKKIEEKYERLYKEQIENCELKIQNNRILWQNYVNNAGWSKASSSAVEISKIEDIGSVQLCQSFTGSKIDEEGSNQQSSIRIDHQADKKILIKPEKSKFGAQIQRIKMIQTNCSPKSNCSYRRFARTSNSGPQYEFSGKIQKSESGLKPLLAQTQTTLVPKFVPQKYNRLSQNSDKPQSALQKQNPSKLQNQKSEIQLEKRKNTFNPQKSSFQSQNLQIFHYNLPTYIQTSQIKQHMKRYDGGISIEISRVIDQDNILQLNEDRKNLKNPINDKLNIRQNSINDREKRKNRQKQKDSNEMDIVSKQVKNLGSCYNLGSTLSTFNSLNIQESRVSSCDRIIEKNEQKLESFHKKIVLRKNGNINYEEGVEGNKNMAYVDRKLRQTIA